MAVSTISTNYAAQVYGANAAPVATNAATLGAASVTTGGNTRVGTGYSSTPATTVSGGGGTAGGSTAINNLAASNVNGAIANAQASVSNLTGAAAPALNQAQSTQVQNAAASIATNQMASAASTSGGGAIGDALKSGVGSIVAFAQKGMADIQKAIQGDMAANNGEVDPAKMQLYTMKMSTYELLNQMAAKIQEKEERAIQVWLR